MPSERNCVWAIYTCSPCFTPLYLNTPCQYTPLLILRPLIFALTPFGSMHLITLNPTYSFISYRNAIFDLRPLFQVHNLGIKQGLDVLVQCVPFATEPGISLIILPLMRILQRNLKRTTDTFLFISHTTNALLFKFRCNIFIDVTIIKEMPGSVASGTHCISDALKYT